VTIPKSATPSRIASNFDVFDFEITADDMAMIDALDREDGRFGPLPSAMN
jgi:2,5-diketo-D-gluconate reductase A